MRSRPTGIVAIGTLLVGGVLGILIAIGQPQLAVGVLLAAILAAKVHSIPAVYGCSVLLACAAFTHPISENVTVFLGPVRLEPIDFGLVAFAVLAIFGKKRSRSDAIVDSRFRTGMALIVGALAVPVLVGLAVGNEWQSVFRAGRVVVFYATFFVAAKLVQTRTDRLVIVWSVAALAATGGAYLLMSRLLGWQWSNGMSDVFIYGGTVSRGFGWWSTMPWFVYGSVVLFVYAWLSASATIAHRIVASCIAAALAVATLSTLIRGDFVGLVIGVIAVVFIAQMRSSDRRRNGYLLVGAVVCGAVIAIYLAFAGPTAAVDVVVERLGSILSPSQTALTGAGTRAYRLLALANGLKSGMTNPVGIGFGAPPSGIDTFGFQVTGWATHSSIAWMGFFLGWLGSLVMAVGAAICASATLRTRALREHWEVVAIVGVLAAMIGQAIAANHLFGSMFVYPLVPILLAGLASTLRGEEVAV